MNRVGIIKYLPLVTLEDLLKWERGWGRENYKGVWMSDAED